MYRLSPRQFEEFVAEILDGLGFAEILLTPRRGDRGRDIVAVKRVEGIPVVFAFECKRYSATRKIGVGICRSLLGTISQSASTANVGVLVTTSTFTKGASEFFLTEASVKGRDFNGVVDWIEDVKLKQRARSARKSGLVLPGFLTDKVLTSDFED
jgi:restriction endonuclease Mrr